MAELNVQPKKQASYLPWILVVLGLAALIWFLTRDKKDVAKQDSIADTTAVNNNPVQPKDPTDTRSWEDVNLNAPAVNYEEVTNTTDINVRGSDKYGIYSVGEDVLFDAGKATLRPDAEAKLKQVAASIKKRYSDGEIRVYGYTDAEGTTEANKELAQQRAEAVRVWLQSNGVDRGRISVNAIGEAKPVASNSTEKGKQQNRRVEIVARSTKAA
ncbi:MAG: OmpA family protein [Ferruginibacter sp.]